MLFEGDGVELAAKVGVVMQGWVAAQKRLMGTGIGRQGVIEGGQSIADLQGEREYSSLLWRNAPRTFRGNDVLSEEAEEAKVASERPEAADENARAAKRPKTE